MKTKSFLLTIFSVLIVSSAAMAQQQSTGNAGLIARLENAKQNCAWKIRTLKGAPQANMLLHQRMMENVLEQLKAGQTVDHQKIVKAFESHSG